MLRRSHALALSLVLGTGSALGLHAAVQGQTRPPTPVPVVAVTRAVSATQTLAPKDLRVVDLPPRAVPAGAIRVLSLAEGRTTAVALVPGQYLLQADLAASPLRDGLREGQVAYTLPLTTPVAGVGIPAGGRVAVIAVLTDSTARPPCSQTPFRCWRRGSWRSRARMGCRPRPLRREACS